MKFGFGWKEKGRSVQDAKQNTIYGIQTKAMENRAAAKYYHRHINQSEPVQELQSSR